MIFYAGGVGSVLMFGFILYCVLDVVMAEPVLIRNLPKLVWLLLVIFVPLIGGIAWLVAGRPERAGLAPGSRESRGRLPPGQRYSTRGNSGADPWPSPPPPLGPDDDPEFLRRLDEKRRRPDEDV